MTSSYPRTYPDVFSAGVIPVGKAWYALIAPIVGPKYCEDPDARERLTAVVYADSGALSRL